MLTNIAKCVKILFQMYSEKFSYSGEKFTKSDYKSEFILSCLKTRDIKSVPWAREMKIMQKLTSIFSQDPDFWYHARPVFILPSLAWFFKPLGKRYLSKKKREFEIGDISKINEAENTFNTLLEEKVGEDYKREYKMGGIMSLNEWMKAVGEKYLTD